MKMAVLPKKTVPKPHGRRSRLVFALPAKKPEEAPALPEWDTRAMLRTLAAKYPNLDPSLLGFTLLACRVQLAPDESRENILAIAEGLIRSDLFDAAARRRAR